MDPDYGVNSPLGARWPFARMSPGTAVFLLACLMHEQQRVDFARCWLASKLILQTMPGLNYMPSLADHKSIRPLPLSDTFSAAAVSPETDLTLTDRISHVGCVGWKRVNIFYRYKACLSGYSNLIRDQLNLVMLFQISLYSSVLNIKLV